MVPPPFRTRRLLPLLNVAAVGLALAAITAATFERMFHTRLAAPTTALPTAILGAAWAWALRSRRTVGRTRLRWGWLASLPLAILNASLASGLMFALDGRPRDTFVLGAMLGATFGAMFWLPALLLTLLCFGVPIAWAQRLADKGLAGEERGEGLIGTFCVVLGASCAWFASGRHPSAERGWESLIAPSLGIAAVMTGALAMALSWVRERRRRSFVREVEAGAVAGYRIDATPEGRVLVRVETHGQGYRVADAEEAICELSEQGEVTRPREGARASTGRLVG